MKRKLLAGFMAVCLILTLLPATALAAEEGTISQPTAGGNAFFANGTPITISESAPNGGKEVRFSSLNAGTSTTAYISWLNEDGELVYLAAPDSLVYVFGGGNGSSTPVTIASTSITMTGGKITRLYGGNYGVDDKAPETNSAVVGDVEITLSGNAVVDYVLYGGGMRNASVQGTVYMDFNGVDLSSEKTNSCYVNGGVHGNGHEGTRNIAEGTMTTDAVVNKVVIRANNSKFALLCGGGGGSTKVQDSDVTLTGCTVESMYLGGINGEVVDSSITATGCTIEDISATNRGFVGTGYVDLNSCNIDKLNTGAANGCFSSDSSGTDGSGVTGRCVWDLDEGTTVTDAQLTPLVIKDDGSYTNTYENLTVQKAGDPLNLEISDFVADEKNADTTTQKTFMVPDGSTLTLNGVTATVTSGSTLTNAGTIDMDETSVVTVANGATMKAMGTVNGGTVTYEEGSTVKKYIARIGNVGYDSLQAAINAAESGDTITLLDNVKASNAGVGVNNSVFTLPAGVTLDGNNWKIEADSENWTSAADNKPASHILSVIEASAGGTPTVIKNLTITGVNDDEGGKYSKAGIHAYAGANVQIEDVDIQNCGSVGIQVNGATVSTKDVQISGSNWGGINVDSQVAYDSKLTVESTTITDANSIYMEHNEKSASQKMEVIVESGTFQSISAYPAALGGDKITIEGGAITNVTNAGAGSVDITGGTITNVANMSAGSIDITGGTITNVTSTETSTGRVDVEGATVTGNVNIAVPSGECVIIYKIDGETVYARGQSVDLDNKSTDRWTEDLPTNPGYSLTSWTSENPSVTAGTRSDDGKSVWLGVEAGKTYVFNAYWTYNTFDSDRPSSGSSSVSTGDYAVSVSGSKHGDVSVSPNRADEGDTVTITAEPDRGYEVGEVTVTDKNGDEIRVRDRGDGEYTFTMPESKVTVKVTFVEESVELPFVDVAGDAYYYDAVAWAVENGVTGGTTATTFSPNSPCTRAQTVTFLWRAAGMPQAVNRVNPFTDVSESDYYYEAVLWAVENGITSGITATTFGSGVTCTRAQVATFLWRYSKDDASTLPNFTDVAEGDYYYGAVAWAVENGVTTGVTDTTFQPADPCTRGQIVTFLYRYMGE